MNLSDFLIGVFIGSVVILMVWYIRNTILLNYAKHQLQWEHERFEFIRSIVEESFIITSIPNHSKDLVVSEDGMVFSGGTMLNFDALKTMTRIMLAQEEDRTDAVHNLKLTLAELGEWEVANPQPEPPTIFGRRLTR
jgi:hypothetical protein